MEYDMKLWYRNDSTYDADEWVAKLTQHLTTLLRNVRNDIIINHEDKVHPCGYEVCVQIKESL